jgi:hypothetical protein
MSLKPSQQTERLAVVQMAARHLLDFASKKDGGFGIMEIFPGNAGAPKHNTPEYTWRGQLAWCWAKAGWLEQRIAGQGTQKHWVYRLLGSGRKPLEMLAGDPIIASYYVSIKRPSSPSADYPATWYQAPQLRDLEPEPEEPKVQRREIAPESESRDELPREEGTGETEETEVASPDHEALGGGEAGVLATFLEQNFQALSTMVATLGEIKKEVRAQSDLVIEAAQKFENAATKDDLANFAVEIAAALSRRSDPETKLALESVQAAINRHEGNHVAITSELSALADRRKADDDALAEKLGKTIVLNLKKEIEKDFTRTSQAAANAANAVDYVSKQAVLQIMKLKDEVALVVASELKKRPAGKAGGVTEKLEKLEERADEIADTLSQLEEVARRVDDSFTGGMAEFKRQAASVQDAHARALETASELVTAARAIVKEMLEVGMERAGSGGVPFSVVKQKALGAIDRLNDAENRVA